jgi:hypothetical protein
MRTSEGMQGVKTAWRSLDVVGSSRSLDVVGSSRVNGDLYIFQFWTGDEKYKII